MMSQEMCYSPVDGEEEGSKGEGCYRATGGIDYNAIVFYYGSIFLLYCAKQSGALHSNKRDN